MAILAQYSLPIPPENVKPLGFLTFSKGMEREY